MKTAELLYGLQDYTVLLSAISEHLNKDIEFEKTVRLSYSFIILELHGESELQLQCRLFIQNSETTISDFYVHDKAKEEELLTFIRHHKPVSPFPTVTNFNNYHASAIQYIEIADAIAKMGLNCAPGDDYRPGYYSEVVISDETIILKQINRHNSRSIDHKDDYHMRDLETFPFTISR